MANWKELNKEFNEVFNKLTDKDWEDWHRDKEKRKTMKKNKYDIYLKAKKVIESCQTKEQLYVARVFLRRAVNLIRKGYDNVIFRKYYWDWQYLVLPLQYIYSDKKEELYEKDK